MEENKKPVAEEPGKDLSAVETFHAKALLRRRRMTGALLYGLSAILTLTYLLNRNQPVHTFLDVVAGILLFFALSFLIWLVPMALFARYMEVSRDENPTATPAK